MVHYPGFMPLYGHKTEITTDDHMCVKLDLEPSQIFFKENGKSCFLIFVFVFSPSI